MVSHKINKVDKPIVISLSHSNTNDKELLVLVKEIEECQKISDSIVKEFEKVSCTIQEFKDTCYGISRSGLDVFNKAVDRASYSSSNKVSYADMANAGIAAAGLATAAISGAIGFLGSKIKERSAEAQKRRQERELREMRQTILYTKKKDIETLAEKLRGGLIDKIETLYSKEIEIEVSATDPLADKRIKAFGQTFGITVKARAINDALNYTIAEMQAWEMGKERSNYISSSLDNIIVDEVRKWLGESANNKIGSGIAREMRNQSPIVKLPIAYLFSDSIMLEHFVGISIPEIKYCPRGLIKLSQFSGEKHATFSNGTVSRFIEKNEFFNKVKKIYMEDVVFPQKRKIPVISDIIYWTFKMLILAAPFYFIFKISDGTFWRITFSAIALLVILIIFNRKQDGDGISDFWDSLVSQIVDYIDNMPSNKYEREYQEACDEIINSNYKKIQEINQ